MSELLKLYFIKKVYLESRNYLKCTLKYTNLATRVLPSNTLPVEVSWWWNSARSTHYSVTVSNLRRQPSLQDFVPLSALALSRRSLGEVLYCSNTSLTRVYLGFT